MLSTLLLLAVLSEAQPQPVCLPAALTAPTDLGAAVDVPRLLADYDDAAWRELRAGKVFTAEVTEADTAQDHRRTVRAAAIFARPLFEVWSVLTDFESRPRYDATAKEVRIVRVEDNRVWLALRRRFFFVDVRFGLINTLDAKRASIAWVMDEAAPHDIGGTAGSWELAPMAEGRETLVVYHAWFDAGRPVPAFVVNTLLRSSLPRALTDVRDEVERRFQHESATPSVAHALSPAQP